MLHALETVLLGIGADCRSNCQQVGLQRLLLFKQIVVGLYLPIFQYITAVDFVQQFVQTSSAKKLCWTPLSIRWSKVLVINFCQVTPLCMINLRNMEQMHVFRIKRCWSVPKSYKLVQAFWRYNQKMWAFKCSCLLFWPTLYMPTTTGTVWSYWSYS